MEGKRDWRVGGWKDGWKGNKDKYFSYSYHLIENVSS